MDSDIDISVIVPAYNAQETIIPCIESILSQTYNANYEIIVINDGSNDQTEQLCLHFKNKNRNANLIVLTQKNSGPSKARNYGILKSTGKWIAFLDADDRWLPQKIEKQFIVLNNYVDCSLIGAQFYKENETYKNGIKVMSFKSLLFKNEILTSTVVVKRDVIMLYLFDESKRYSEDCKLWLQIAYHYKVIVILEGLVIYYQPNPNEYEKNLSNSLFKMEKGELDNFMFFYRAKMINIFSLMIIIFFSVLKYLKRLILASYIKSKLNFSK